MTKQQQIKIESSKRMKTNERGEGVVDGERFTLYVDLDGIVLRSMSYCGDSDYQDEMRRIAQKRIESKGGT